jgi:phosphatidylserine/phosphatidylglycerophosphate/cardiolipin synthase-like enzyme
MVIDGQRGYLGSANLSFAGLERNFEVGIALSGTQSDALDRLLTYFESANLLVDHTQSIISG